MYNYGIIIPINLNQYRSFMENVLLRLLDEYKKTTELLIQERLKNPPTDSYSSTETKDLYAALAKAQGEYPVIGYNRENPYFKSKYTDLDGILKAVRPALSKNNLSFIQQLRIVEGGATVMHTIITHATGQWIESRTRIVPPKNDVQSFGSTLTYCRRYTAIAILGVTISDDDDDGERAMVDAREIYAKGVALNTKYDPRIQSADTITKEQLDELEYELAEYPDIAEMVLDGLKIQSIADMPKSKYHTSIKRIREIKQARNEGKRE
jgi:hypothetical protein